MAVRFFREVLPDLQQRALRTLAGPVTLRGFYLAGGTALALQLGHRRSVDFDWFRTDPVTDPLQLAAELRADSVDLHVTGTSPRTLHGEVCDVQVSLLPAALRLVRGRFILSAPAASVRRNGS